MRYGGTLSPKTVIKLAARFTGLNAELRNLLLLIYVQENYKRLSRKDFDAVLGGLDPDEYIYPDRNARYLSEVIGNLWRSKNGAPWLRLWPAIEYMSSHYHARQDRIHRE